ncbi:hypothetical protein BGW80DRAFT_278189 [Lactifluus volemus]|nr:hypothetical protein BGW80DRAFT_278189 [Lactifluus volemus]
MSRTEYRTLDVKDLEEAYYQAKMAHNWEPESIYTDSSGPLFNMYSNMTKNKDKNLKEAIHSMDSIILVTTLFSTVIAALLALTIPDLRPIPQATAAFYLENMYKLQLLTNPNTSLSFTPTLSSQSSVSTNAILVNTLLLTSLCINIFLAFMALWIRGRVPRYLSDTESPQLSPHYRARMHEILSSGFYDSRIFVPLVLMQWLSPLFFFTGLSLYLFNINRVVFRAVLGCICLCFIASCFIFHWLDKVSASYTVLFSFCQA